MIYDLIMQLRGGASPRDVVPGILFTIIVVLFSLSLHESAHGFMAYKLGDKTARNLGRLTLAPHKHLDLFGTICMLMFGFGWAKPVPIATRNFKKPRRDMALTALAGPVSNLLLSFLCCLIWVLLVRFNGASGTFFASGFTGDVLMDFGIIDKILALLSMLFFYGHLLNLSLAVFNFLPFPPLDGSRILFVFLPDKLYFGVMKYERIISIVLLALLWGGFLTKYLSYFSNLISNGMIYIISLIPGL